MHLFDGCASRISPNQAHLDADYIRLLRKSYFAAQLDLDDAVSHARNPCLQRLRSKRDGLYIEHLRLTLAWTNDAV